MDRRRFIQTTALGAIGTTNCGVFSSNAPVRNSAALILDARDPSANLPFARERIAAIEENHQNFPVGVMAGDVTDSRAIIWTRYTGPHTLTLWTERVGKTQAFQSDLVLGEDGFTHVDLGGLEPGTEYRYTYFVRDGERVLQRGPSGRFRTAIAANSDEVVTFGGTSCTNQYLRPFPAMQHAAMRGDLDFFIHCGDHVYCDFSYSLEEYRSRYASGWPAYGMKALHSSMAQYATWDDHEVANNWDAESQSPNRVAIARHAFLEHHPIRLDINDTSRIWRSFRWGQTLELFILDCRGERLPSTRARSDAQYISHQQLEWLKHGLQSSTSLFKFVVNSVPITDFPGIMDFAANDRWEGYPAQRNELLDFIEAQHIRNVWWLSGDLHFGCIAKLQTEGPRSRMREVLMGPGRQLGNVFADSLSGSQWEFITKANNYTWFRADPRTRTLEVKFFGEFGAELCSRQYQADPL